MANPDRTPEDGATEKRSEEPSDRRVAERRMFPPRPESRRHDGGRRAEDGEDA